MPQPPICIVEAETPEGVKAYVTCIRPEIIAERGLRSEAIIGVLRHPVEVAEAIIPENFVQNRAFVDFLHEVIGRRGPGVSGLMAEAARQREGAVAIGIIDERTPTPLGEVPSEDIIGTFDVEGGQVAFGSYRANPHHRILTDRGFFQLEAELLECLLEELEEPQ
jgi:hypothetical protein